MVNGCQISVFLSSIMGMGLGSSEFGKLACKPMEIGGSWEVKNVLQWCPNIWRNFGLKYSFLLALFFIKNEKFNDSVEFYNEDFSVGNFHSDSNCEKGYFLVLGPYFGSKLRQKGTLDFLQLE